MMPLRSALLAALVLVGAMSAAATTRKWRDCDAALRGLNNFELLETMQDLRARFEQRLAPSPNLFRRGLDYAQARDVYMRLLSRPGVDKRELSLFGEINLYLQSQAPRSAQRLRPLVARALHEARARLEDPRDDILEDFRNLEALKALIPTFQGLLPKPSAENQVLPDQLAPPLRYPKIPDAYTPHNKDVAAAAAAANETKVLAWTNAQGVRYFRMKAYTFIRRGSRAPFAIADLPGAITETAPYRETEAVLNLDPLGATDVEIPVPVGYVPLRLSFFKDSRVERLASGAFILHSDGRGPVEIPLARDDETLTEDQAQFLSQPVGVAFSEWPPALRELLRDVEPLPPRERLRAVEKYLTENSEYSLRGGSPRDPVAALAKGRYQCDLANYILAAIARDILRLPARVAAGFIGHGREGTGDSFLLLPDVAHAWTEVYLDGHWELFDPVPKTPRHPARPESQSGYHENRERPTASDAAPAPTENPPATDRGRPADSALPVIALQELARDPLTTADRARRLVLRQILDPGLATRYARRLLENTRESGLFKNHPAEILAENADALLAQAQGPVVDALYALSAGALDPGATFRELGLAESRLAFFVSLLDAEDRAPLNRRLGELRALKKSLSALTPTTSPTANAARKFLNELPPIAREVLEERYAGDDEALATDLEAGRLADFALMRRLNPLVDFVMSGAAERDRRLLTLEARDRRFTRGPEWLPVTNPGRLRRGLKQQPDKSAFANFVEGTLIEPARREQVMHARGNLRRRSALTLGLYDTSLSLEGAAADFLAGLLATFTDRAISDVDRDGRLRHRCMLMGFDSEARARTPIFDRAQARALLTDFRKILKNTGGTTNIRAAIQAAVDYAKEMRGQGLPLASLEILLVSDGADEIETEELRALLGEVDPETPIRFFFVSIKGVNPKLRALTRNARAAGAADAFYRGFDLGQINHILEDARALPQLNPDKEFYTAPGSAATLPPDFAEATRALARGLLEDLRRFASASEPRSESAWRDEMLKMNFINAAAAPSPEFVREVRRVRTLLASQPALRAPLVARLIFDDFLKNMPERTGRKLKDLGVKEQLELGQLLDEVLIYAGHR